MPRHTPRPELDPWTWEYGDQFTEDHPDIIDVTVGDDKIIGTILGPDGQPLHTVRPANWRPFGFTKPT